MKATAQQPGPGAGSLPTRWCTPNNDHRSRAASVRPSPGGLSCEPRRLGHLCRAGSSGLAACTSGRGLSPAAPATTRAGSAGRSDSAPTCACTARQRAGWPPPGRAARPTNGPRGLRDPPRWHDHSGLSATDVGATSTITGLASEFYLAVGREYGQRGPVYDFEPKVASSVIGAMLRASRTTVLIAQPLHQVLRDGTVITAITTEAGSTIEATQFIDASYEGDLLARAGVSSHVGRKRTTPTERPSTGCAWPPPAPGLPFRWPPTGHRAPDERDSPRDPGVGAAGTRERGRRHHGLRIPSHAHGPPPCASLSLAPRTTTPRPGTLWRAPLRRASGTHSISECDSQAASTT